MDDARGSGDATVEARHGLWLVAEWERTYNEDVESLVNDLYAPDAELGGQVLGPDRLLKLERRVLAAAPRRTLRVERTHTSGDVVTVEGVLLDPDQGADWRLPFCAVLTLRDGRIVSDRTYTEFSRWPGMG